MTRRFAAMAACLAVAGCGGEQARPDAAARLVPSDALAYVHVDLGDERLGEVASKFTAVERLLEGFEQLAGGGVDAWLADEAALALIDSGRPAADTLLLLEVRDADRARRAVPAAGGVTAALAGDYLAIGQERVVRRAVGLSRGRGEGLERTADGAVDAWLPASGVRRVLQTQPGLVGALGAALDDPRLRFVDASVEVDDEGVRVTVRRARRGVADAATFEPRLIEDVPAEAAAYLGLAGAAPLLERLGLGDLRLGEVAIWVQPSLPLPVLSAVAEVDDERAARGAVARTLGRLAERLAAGRHGSAGRIAQIEERRLPGGLTASVLELSAGAELSVAVSRGRLMVATSPAALGRVPAGDRGLPDDERFRRVLGDLPEQVEALGFADLAQLLTLGEQAGLAGGRAAGAALDDLRSIRVIGATAEREGSDTTAEFFFEIP